MRNVQTFQSTPLREGRRGSCLDIRIHCIFQSTPLREGRPKECLISTEKALIFQSTPLREGRPNVYDALYNCYEISIHAPARGATGSLGDSDHLLNFNPRPCARGDVSFADLIRQWRISIHAPARGATSTPWIPSAMLAFQSTPLREGRQWRRVQKPDHRNFNPRPCARGDRRPK